MSRMKKITQHIIIVLALFLSLVSYAQEEDCSEKLALAQVAFNDGVLENVETNLTACLTSGGFSKPEQVQAYKLLTLVGLFEDNFKLAEENMTLLLKTDPDFIPKASDPFELKDLYAKFRTDPFFTVGVKAGLNIGYATVLQYSSVGRTNDQALNMVDGFNGSGFQGALSYNHMINKGLYVNFDPRYSIINHRMEEILGSDSVIRVIKNESISLISGDLGLSYDFRYLKPVKYYIEAGLSGAILVNSTAKMVKRYTDNSGLDEQESEIDLLGKAINSEYESPSNRTKNMMAVYYGFGVKYKMGTGHILFGIRHVIGQTNITEDRSNVALYGKYDYILKDISLNSVMFNIGFVQSIYVPKILKRNLK